MLKTPMLTFAATHTSISRAQTDVGGDMGRTLVDYNGFGGCLSGWSSKHLSTPR